LKDHAGARLDVCLAAFEQPACLEAELPQEVDGVFPAAYGVLVEDVLGLDAL
jgi:hypothetical protein